MNQAMSFETPERLIADRQTSTADMDGPSTSTCSTAQPVLAQLYGIPGLPQELVLPNQRHPRRRVLRFVLGSLGKLRRRCSEDAPAGSSEDGDAQVLLEEAVDLQAQLTAMENDPCCSQEQRQQLHKQQLHLAQQLQQQCASEQQPEQRHTGRLEGLLRQLLRAVVRCANALAPHVSPQGPGINDGTLAERLLNVVTSLPFVAIGVQAFRTRKSGVGKHFGASFMVVGAVATVYHAVQGPIRPHLRKMDYYAIAYSTSILRRAAHVPLPRVLTVLCTLATPLKPTAVTMLNMLLVEGQYAKAVLSNRHLLPTWGWHLAASLIGGATFVAEDVAIAQSWPPVFHAAWHCLSAAAVGTATCGLLNHLEMDMGQAS